MSQAAHVGLALTLALGGVSAVPPAAKAAEGTPGGVGADGLRLWLKADPASFTLEGGSIAVWKDSSPNGNDFKNDGTVGTGAPRPKPTYVPAHAGLNGQPAVKFIRSGGSLLQDADGLFADNEDVSHASLFTAAGGANQMANSSVFNQPLVSGSMGVHLPHTTGASAGKGNVLWDVGPTSTRLTAGDAMAPKEYNVWGLHFDAPPTVGSIVYQSISGDGKTAAQTTSTRSPMKGKGNTAASLGSAAGGGSGFDGYMGELILFTNALTISEKRQVETYLAVKFGTTLKEGDYLSAGPSPEVVWNAAAHAGYGNRIAGIARDQEGALNVQQSRSSQGAAAEQVLITAVQPLADKQYLLWGDNGSTEQAIPHGSEFKRLARTWKVQNTGNTGTVQAAIPASVIPLGGVLLTSGDSSFSQATSVPLTETTIGGEAYYAANVTLQNGSYFTFAEKLPGVQLTTLEIWNGAQNVLPGFLPSETTGYKASVPHEADKVRVVAQANGGTTVNLTLTHYLQANAPIADPTQVPLVPGVNKLKAELSNGSASNIYEVEIIRSLDIASDGKIGLNAGSVTASSFQPNTTYVPANVVDGNWEDPESRWSASGQGQWLQFDLGQPLAATYVKIAFLNAKERLSTFEILESDDPAFAASTVLLAKRNSRTLLSTDSVLQPYVLEKPASKRYVRMVGYGNTASGSSGGWNSLTELALYTGTPPVIVEPEEPTGPPKAGDVPEGPAPVAEIVRVSTAAGLQAALDRAKPGQDIRLASGTYEQNGPFVLKNKQGTVAQPIRIMAEEQGQAVIQGNSFLHIEGAKYVEVSGLVFNSGIGTVGLDYRGMDEAIASILRADDPASLTVPKAQLPNQQVHPGLQLYNSSNISVLRNKFALDETGQPYRFNAPNGVGQVWCLTGVEGSCRIGGGDRYNPELPVYTGDTPHTNPTLVTDNGTHRHFLRVEGIGSHNRIAYNDIGHKKGFGATVIYDGQSGHNVSEYDVIEYNYFHDIGPRVTNGLEVIRLGLSGLSLASGHVTIQHNLFEDLNAEDEIISVKSSDNIIRYNTIRNSYGGIVARHGHRNSFYGNFIFGDGKTAGFSGFRIYGNGHKIYNNYMEGLTTNVIRLDGGTHDAGPDGGTNPTVRWMEGASEQTAVLNTLPPDKQTEILRGHWRQYNVEIFNNTMVNVGNNTAGFSFGGRTYQPVGTKIYNNVVFSNAGTIFNETSAEQNVPANERQIYVGNLVDGIANPTNISDASRVPASAIAKLPLLFVRSADGLIRLSAGSPAIDASKAPFLPQEDMDGQYRYGTPDAGADEYNRQTAPVRKPLTSTDVGPNAGSPAQEETPGLSALTLQPGSQLVPDFLPNATYYHVLVPSGVTDLRVVPTALSGSSQIMVSVDGAGSHQVASGKPSQVLAIAPGGSVIRVEVTEASGKSKTYTISIKKEQDSGNPSEPGMPLDRIEFAPSAYSLKVNAKVGAVVQAVYQGNPKPLTGATFFTAQPEIATVNAQGVLTGVAKGTTVVVATYNNFSATANVTVTVDPPTVPDNGSGDDGGSGGGPPAPTPAPAPVPAPVTPAPAPSKPAEPAPSVPAPSVKPVQFADAAGHWAGDMIAEAAKLGIVQGFPDGSFKPEEPMTRLQFAAMLVRTLKLAAGQLETDFADQSDIPSWAAAELAAAVKAGILQGYDDNTLRPHREINRAEMVTMLLRALKLEAAASAAPQSFRDEADIPGWASASVAYAVELGLVQGKENNRFAPQDTATRAEAVTLIMRMLKLDQSG
ncbi:Cadherin-like beta sandwich domain-containing protein [Paenibacillus sp. UNCCL117]|uniref:chondroitinase-B domain-containing protein n=1 Tax=unclassified Paenibacillus TaxID=185978 RepID=UPI0008811E60|nr:MULTISPECIES: chondroitinase-B domain-containing protein [unclassified Paenibacillus]SDD56085.1 Cadherin-like beta sandwich domain-containing protein [Paenibacillus sp. cl123]SFW51455.1 Cadherin-like beta sandwich domain-containing protein [Paenibacillus sp. UNCCL117]